MTRIRHANESAMAAHTHRDRRFTSVPTSRDAGFGFMQLSLICVGATLLHEQCGPAGLILLETLDVSGHRFDSSLHLGIAFRGEFLARFLKGCSQKRHLDSAMRRYILAAIDYLHDLVEGKFSTVPFRELSEVGRRWRHR